MKITSINFEESVQSKRLIFRKNFEYYFDLSFQFFVNIALLFGVFINLINWNNYGRNERFFLIVFIIFTLFFNYLLFKKLTENKLISIITNNNTKENKIIIIQYFKENEIFISKNSENIILAIDDLGSIGPFNWKKNHIVILFDKNEILFTLLTERNKVNFANLFDKISLRNDLRKVTRTGSCEPFSK